MPNEPSQCMCPKFWILNSRETIGSCFFFFVSRNEPIGWTDEVQFYWEWGADPNVLSCYPFACCSSYNNFYSTMNFDTLYKECDIRKICQTINYIFVNCTDNSSDTYVSCKVWSTLSSIFRKPGSVVLGCKCFVTKLKTWISNQSLLAQLIHLLILNTSKGC